MQRVEGKDDRAVVCPDLYRSCVFEDARAFRGGVYCSVGGASIGDGGGGIGSATLVAS